MAKKQDLMGLGMGPFLAERMADVADGAILVTAAGASRASAYQIGRSQYLVAVVSTNGGAGINLPPLGGDFGAFLGDPFTLHNNGGNGAVTVYAPVGTSVYQSGAVISGSGGLTLASGFTMQMQPMTVSSWLGILSA